MTEEHKVVEIDLWGDVVFEYFTRVKKHDDELGIVLKGHLFMEYLLNQIISAKCKSPERILRDSRSFTFAVKLQLIYSMGLLPDHVHKNILKLNNIRNELAHNLDFNEDKIDMRLLKDNGTEVVMKPRGRKNPKRYFLRMFCLHTLNQLAAHMQSSLKLSRKYDKSVFIVGLAKKTKHGS